MAAVRTIHQLVSELRSAAKARLRRGRLLEIAPQLTRLLDSSRTVAIEQRVGGIAFRLQAVEEHAAEGEPAFMLTCVLHDAAEDELTPAERAVAGQLCEGRTLAQIARLRGVSPNTVKSQVRQIFRKLDVETRVALVRRMCP